MLGNPKSKVTVIEYASLTCPHCAHFQEEEYPKLKAAYIDTNKIKYIYRDFPLDGLATGAALLARCAPNGRGITMVSARNRVVQIASATPVQMAGVTVRENDYVLADRCGSVFIPAERIEEVIALAERITRREDGMVEAVRNGRSVEDVMHDKEFEAIKVEVQP